MSGLPGRIIGAVRSLLVVVGEIILGVSLGVVEFKRSIWGGGKGGPGIA